MLGDVLDSVLADQDYVWGPGERVRAVAVAGRLRAAWNSAPRAAREELTAPVDDEPICGRLLVGQGDDTYDPLCVLKPGHDDVCEPGTDDA